MIKTISIQKISVTESDLDNVKMICNSLRIHTGPALTTIRATHNALNSNDFCKGLELYVDRIQNKSHRYADRLIAESALASRFFAINNLADESCILSGFAANNLFYHCLCLVEKDKIFFLDIGDILEDQLQNEFAAGNDDTTLITPCEINEVIEKFDYLYPGFFELIKKNKTVFAIIDAYKKTEDGCLISIIQNPDSETPVTRNYIFLMKPRCDSKRKAVLVHELCHLLLEIVSEYKELSAMLEELLGIVADLERAEMNGEKEEVICNLMTAGVLKNEIFSSDDYQDAHATYLLDRLGEEIVSATMETANVLFSNIVKMKTLAESDRIHWILTAGQAGPNDAR